LGLALKVRINAMMPFAMMVGMSLDPSLETLIVKMAIW
jgi:hypothetical protein